MQFYRTPDRVSPTDVSLRPPRIGAGAAIALTFLIVGLSFWIDPTVIHRSQVGQDAEPWAHIWNTLYILGGTAVLAGRWHTRHVIGAEVLGVCLLAGGWLMNLTAVWTLHGIDARSLTYVVFVWWAYTRYRDLMARV